MNAKKMVLVSVFFSSALFVTQAMAGGLIGDLVEMGCGGCGVGKAGDKVHRQFKNANPDYAEAETKLTNDVRKATGQKPICQNPLFDRRGNEVGCGD